MSSQSTIAYTNGPNASANLTANSVAYVTPGNMLGITLQNNVGAVTWNLQIQSDNPNINGQDIAVNPTSTFFLPLPVQQCTITVTSITQDGQNATQTTNKFYCFPQQTAIDRSVRLVLTSNVNMANCNVASIDGVNPTLGDRILLVGQTNTQSQNGPYIFSSWANAAANLATLTRPADYLTGAVLTTPPMFEVTEGASWANSTWKALGTLNVSSPLTIDTSNAFFFPRVFTSTIVNVATSNANVLTAWVASNSVGVYSSITSASATNSVTLVVSALVATSLANGAGSGRVAFTVNSAAGYLGNAVFSVINF